MMATCGITMALVAAVWCATQPDSPAVALHQVPARGALIARYASPSGAGECEIGCDFESGAFYWVTQLQVVGTDCEGHSFSGEPRAGGVETSNVAIDLVETLGNPITGLIGRELAARRASPAEDAGSCVGRVLVCDLPAGARFPRMEPAAGQTDRVFYCIDAQGRITAEWTNEHPSQLRREYSYSTLSPPEVWLVSPYKSFELVDARFMPATDRSMFAAAAVEARAIELRRRVQATMTKHRASAFDDGSPAADTPLSTPVPGSRARLIFVIAAIVALLAALAVVLRRRLSR